MILSFWLYFLLFKEVKAHLFEASEDIAKVYDRISQSFVVTCYCTFNFMSLRDLSNLS